MTTHIIHILFGFTLRLILFPWWEWSNVNYLVSEYSPVFLYVLYSFHSRIILSTHMMPDMCDCNYKFVNLFHLQSLIKSARSPVKRNAFLCSYIRKRSLQEGSGRAYCASLMTWVWSPEPTVKPAAQSRPMTSCTSCSMHVACIHSHTSTLAKRH